MSRTIFVVAALLFVSFQASSQRVTYSKDIAPIFYEHCASCHRPGEIAPMSLLTYESARPWAKSIAKAVSARVMPPWSGESDKQVWINDISLNQEQIDSIMDWVAQGAREGNPDDLPEVPVFPETWVLGEPDYIVELPTV